MTFSVGPPGYTPRRSKASRMAVETPVSAVLSQLPFHAGIKHCSVLTRMTSWPPTCWCLPRRRRDANRRSWISQTIIGQ